MLYLFLLWVARSALKDLRRGTDGAYGPARTDDATGMHVASSGVRRDSDGGEPKLRVDTAAGLQAGSAYYLSEGAVLGRGEQADIQLEDTFASSQHARLVPHGEVMVLEDLGSTNGTYLNEEPLRGPQPLHPGDRIRIGDCSSPSNAEHAAIAEQFHGSDLGRQRQGNEDNYFVRAPLFVVADGMGGAQAGEVASEMAVESFDDGLPDGSPGRGAGARSSRTPTGASTSARAATSSAGMGTTVTAAYVGENEVTVAHVGDSRGYLWRDGELTRLTRDHSLVGELVARGKLTEEQAEAHPQRSVITRALGPRRTCRSTSSRRPPATATSSCSARTG